MYAVGIFSDKKQIIEILGNRKIFYDFEEIGNGNSHVLWVSDQTSEQDILIIKAVELDEIGICGYPRRMVEIEK